MSVGVLVAAAIALALSVWVGWCRARLVTVVVDGSSMAPTLSTHDRVVVRRARGHRLAAGQLVVFTAPVREAGVWVWRPASRPADDPMAPAWVIKRIAAVADDPVPPAVASAVPAAVVPAGSIVVLGENPDASVDSRLFGPVPIECVLGSVTGRRPDSRGEPVGRRTARWTWPTYETGSRRPGRRTARRTQRSAELLYRAGLRIDREDDAVGMGARQRVIRIETQ